MRGKNQGRSRACGLPCQTSRPVAFAPCLESGVAHTPPLSVEAAPLPPLSPRVYLSFLRVRPGPGVLLAFLSPAWWSCYTHFDGRRTVYCPGAPRSACPRSCPTGSPRWTAYAVVYPGPRDGPRLVAWCAQGHADSPELQAAAGRLAGRVFLARRADERANSPLVWTADPRPAASPLPRVLDVRAYLSRLWSVPL